MSLLALLHTTTSYFEFLGYDIEHHKTSNYISTAFKQFHVHPLAEWQSSTTDPFVFGVFPCWNLRFWSFMAIDHDWTQQVIIAWENSLCCKSALMAMRILCFFAVPNKWILRWLSPFPNDLNLPPACVQDQNNLGPAPWLCHGHGQGLTKMLAISPKQSTRFLRLHFRTLPSSKNDGAWVLLVS